MSTGITIALDAMSGDHGLDVTIPASVLVATQNPQLKLILVGNEAQIHKALDVGSLSEHVRQRISICHASEIVEMDEPPAQALRNKKDSSMRIAINLVKDKTADACVSAGNTGALMATARFVLKMIPGINRPAICSALPAKQGHTHMMDLGANIDCNSEHLYQFALMGSVLVSNIDSQSEPRVALLNIGEEEIKGNDTIKGAHQLLSDSHLNYIGYVEGNDIFDAKADVIICDGFAGNIALKSAEGVAHMISHFMKEAFSKNLLSKLCGLIALPVLRSFKNKIDPRAYNGASLLGLQGIVVKSHGGADKVAFANAIKIAMLEVEANITCRISQQIDGKNNEH